MVLEKNNDNSKHAYRNFPRAYGFPRCVDCREECIIRYDSHHDEYFSETCGLVLMEQGHCYQSNIYDDVNINTYLRYLKNFIKHNEKVIYNRKVSGKK